VADANALRVHLGADAWALLASALPDAVLPHPFRSQDCPQLDAAARTATERALRDAGLLVGRSGDLLADLAPWMSAAMAALARPTRVVDSSVGLGDMLRIGHHALRGDLAAGLVRSQRPAGDDALELGPVELSAVDAEDLGSEALRGFGTLDGGAERRPVTLDAAASAEVADALDGTRADVALAVIERRALPPTPDARAQTLRAVARVDVVSAAGRRLIVAVRVADGWWVVDRPAEGVTLRPAGEVELAAALAAATAA